MLTVATAQKSTAPGTGKSTERSLIAFLFLFKEPQATGPHPTFKAHALREELGKSPQS